MRKRTLTVSGRHSLDRAFEHVGGPYELGDRAAARRLIDFRRCAELQQATVLQDGNPVAHGHRLFLVMGDVDEGHAELAMHALELDLHELAQVRIERAERLIE